MGGFIVKDPASTGGGGGGGEANTSSNVGTGQGLALPKSGVDLPFKSIKATGAASVSSDATSVTIDVPSGGSANLDNVVLKTTGGTAVNNEHWLMENAGASVINLPQIATISADPFYFRVTNYQADGVVVQINPFPGDKIDNIVPAQINLDGFASLLFVFDSTQIADSWFTVKETVFSEDLRTKDIFSQAEISLQAPQGLDTPMQIRFGIPGTSTAGEVTLSDDPATLPINQPAGGLQASKITINEEGFYEIETVLNYGRVVNTNTVYLYAWLEINGIQAGNTAFAKLQTSSFNFRGVDVFKAYLTAGTELKYFIYRDSQGFNDGGLGADQPLGVPSLNPVPSTSLTIRKNKVV